MEHSLFMVNTITINAQIWIWTFDCDYIINIEAIEEIILRVTDYKPISKVCNTKYAKHRTFIFIE